MLNYLWFVWLSTHETHNRNSIPLKLVALQISFLIGFLVLIFTTLHSPWICNFSFLIWCPQPEAPFPLHSFIRCSIRHNIHSICSSSAVSKDVNFPQLPPRRCGCQTPCLANSNRFIYWHLRGIIWFSYSTKQRRKVDMLCYSLLSLWSKPIFFRQDNCRPDAQADLANLSEHPSELFIA